jgi:hypothetical protein
MFKLKSVVIGEPTVETAIGLCIEQVVVYKSPTLATPKPSVVVKGDADIHVQIIM